ncbi:MAG: hypothetical protein HUU10_02690 [Bacteroidetes bacterium]|nr:hypothetical protein [Bacteroidota bacterium]
MGKWILCLVSLLLCGNLFAAGQADSTDSWLGEDKLKHAAVSAWLTGAGLLVASHQTGSSSRAREVVIPSVILIGLGKELADTAKPGGYFSWKDLTADLVGVTLMLLVVYP